MSNGVFFCDISNTITGNIDRTLNLTKLVNNLKQIKEKNKLDNLEFSFVSGDTVDYVKKYMEEIKFYLDQVGINLGTCFSDDERIDSDGNVSKCPTTKIEQIKEIIKSRNDVEKVFFADDNKIETVIVQNVLLNTFPNLDCEIFRPEDGIVSLNTLLEEYIEDIKEKKR